MTASVKGLQDGSDICYDVWFRDRRILTKRQRTEPEMPELQVLISF